MQSKLLVALFAALALTACQKAEEAAAPAIGRSQGGRRRSCGFGRRRRPFCCRCSPRRCRSNRRSRRRSGRCDQGRSGRGRSGYRRRSTGCGRQGQRRYPI